MLSEFGRGYQATGNLTRALQAYEESLAIARRLAATDATHTEGQRDLSVILDKIGDVRWAAGGPAAALQAYEESLAIRRRLAATDPTN